MENKNHILQMLQTGALEVSKLKHKSDSEALEGQNYREKDDLCVFCVKHVIPFRLKDMSIGCRWDIHNSQFIQQFTMVTKQHLTLGW